MRPHPTSTFRALLVALLALGLVGGAALAQAPAEKPKEKAPEKPDDKKPDDKKPDEKKTEAKKFKLKVMLPDEDAELTIEKQATKQSGKTREFDLPPLETGRQYEYALVATWRPNNYTVITRTKNLTFKPGADVTADLTADDATDKAVIRYVPTPDDIVAKMIALAKVTKDDTVYEPGCGDGRITVAAVKAGAKKGVGIDLDAERVAEAKANVKKAALEDKIDIRKGDALDIKDFSDANVVFLYMGNEFNALIRPTLWKSLKVGTRIVSHRFTMGDWAPDKTEKIKGEDGDEYEVHVWTITKELKDKAEGKKPAEEKKPEAEKKDEKKPIEKNGK